MSYTPQPKAPTETRILALLAAIGPDLDEIAYTLVDEDETAFPGGWANCGMDRGAAISEYMHEIDHLFGKEH